MWAVIAGNDMEVIKNAKSRFCEIIGELEIASVWHSILIEYSAAANQRMHDPIES